MKFITFSATRTALFFTISLVIIIGFRNVIADSMYGEDDDYLGNIVDSFVNDDNVNFTYNVLHDNVSYLMKLEYGGDIFENFTIYDEVDSDNDITVNGHDISWNTLRRDAESWVVYDFGLDYFTDFELNFTIDLSDIEAGDSSSRDIIAIPLFSTVFGTFADCFTGNQLLIFLRQQTTSDDNYRYVLRQQRLGVQVLQVIGVNLYAMPKHFITFKRLDTQITILIYSDEARTTLVETIAGVGETDPYRYFEALASYDSPTGDPADHSTGIVGNYTFGASGGYLNGYFLLNDILEGNRVIAIMYNVTIPYSTGITMEFFNGIEYVNHDNASGHEVLSDGFESIDLRDLNVSVIPSRINMTGSVTNTPFFSQIRYMTIVGEVEGGGIDITPSIIMTIFLIMIGISLIYSVRRKR